MGFNKLDISEPPIPKNYNPKSKYFISFSGLKIEYHEDVNIGRAREVKIEFKADGVYTMDRELTTVEAFAEIKKHLMEKHNIKNCVISFYKKLN